MPETHLKEWKFNEEEWHRIEISEHYVLITSERHAFQLGFCSMTEMAGIPFPDSVECTPCTMEMSVIFTRSMAMNYTVSIKEGDDLLAVIEKHAPAATFGAMFIQCD